MPVTRAKSPNLTRRKSCSDAKSCKPSPEEKGGCARTKRHSFGFCKEGSTTNATLKNRDVVGGRNLAAAMNREGSSTPTRYKNTPNRQNVNGANRVREHPKLVKEASKTPVMVQKKRADVSVVEEVTKVADHITDITVVEETTKTPCAVPDQISADNPIVDEATKDLHTDKSTSEIAIET